MSKRVCTPPRPAAALRPVSDDAAHPECKSLWATYRRNAPVFAYKYVERACKQRLKAISIAQLADPIVLSMPAPSAGGDDVPKPRVEEGRGLSAAQFCSAALPRSGSASASYRAICCCRCMPQLYPSLPVSRSSLAYPPPTAIARVASVRLAKISICTKYLSGEGLAPLCSSGGMGLLGSTMRGQGLGASLPS
ncbi:hypothetical protein BDY21DRAFT_135796 [Lineolata rhizophorae]|uniref:Uncharacterized protein n=1 Tax=Lineolata rhizophorae TaxID=578093 RepID=A0A6A6PAU3_9PEZI|nr:hypothetical protein BDY21DRAFT_135796 [Lineolata rhizophorae]